MKFLQENLFQDSQLEVLRESVNGKKRLYLEGPTVMCDLPNRNGRNYPLNTVGIPTVEQYVKDYVMEGRASGELEHPDYPFPNSKEAAVKLSDFEWHGSNCNSKAMILNNPNGQIIESLIDADFKLGISTRGLGDVITDHKGVGQVQEGYIMTAADIVSRPSGQLCYMNAVRESVEWIQESDGSWRPSVEKGDVIDKIVKQEMVNESEFKLKLYKALNHLN